MPHQSVCGVGDTGAAVVIACTAGVRTGLAGHPSYTMQIAVPKSLLVW